MGKGNGDSGKEGSYNKKVDKLKEQLKGKPPKKKKPIVPVSQMKNTTLYVGLDDRKLYRKLTDTLEVLDKNGWNEVSVSYGFLRDKQLREY